MADSTQPKSPRLHSLDLVRALALLLGIVFHAALAYLPGPPIWLVNDSAQSASIGALSFLLHSFRMTTFFLLAGYFGHMVIERRGVGAFARDRAKRIMGPLLVFWMPVLAGFATAVAFGAAIGAIPVPDPPPPPPELTIEAFPLTHLWFLYVLAIFYVVFIALHAIAGMIDKSGKMGAAGDAALAFGLRTPILPVVLAAASAAVLLGHEGWVEWWGIPTPDIGLVPNRTAMIIYGAAFGCGWLIHRLPDGLAPLQKLWPIYLAIAAALTVASMAMTGLDAAIGPELAGNEKIAFALAYGGMIWFWTFGLIGAAIRFIKAERPWVRYMADASYWLYIIHLPLVVAMQAVVFSWAVPAELKLVAGVAISMAIMLATYQWLVRYTFIGTWLNGKRVRSGHRQKEALA